MIDYKKLLEDCNAPSSFKNRKEFRAWLVNLKYQLDMFQLEMKGIEFKRLANMSSARLIFLKYSGKVINTPSILGLRIRLDVYFQNK